ncbi:MAG: methyltransferase domain-containing protein [Nitrospirae bacterium]|nr:methyltransferase domain-containing protein [Nitrospirota bacterium]
MDVLSYSSPDVVAPYAAYCKSLKSRNAYVSLARHLIHTAALKKGERVLDLGCGCGESTKAILQVIGKTGTVIGVDPSEPMIESARRNLGDSNVAFNVSTAEAVQQWVKPESVDSVISSAAIWYLDFSLTLAAARAVLKAHGALAFNLRWDVMPDDLPLAKASARFMTEFGKKVVELAQHVEPGYSPTAHPAPERRIFKFIEMYKTIPTSGFTLMQCKVFEVGTSPQDFLAWLKCPREGARFLPGLAPKKQERVFQQVLKELKPKAIRQKFADVLLYRD